MTDRAVGDALLGMCEQGEEGPGLQWQLQLHQALLVKLGQPLAIGLRAEELRGRWKEGDAEAWSLGHNLCRLLPEGVVHLLLGLRDLGRAVHEHVQAVLGEEAVGGVESSLGQAGEEGGEVKRGEGGHRRGHKHRTHEGLGTQQAHD